MRTCAYARVLQKNRNDISGCISWTLSSLGAPVGVTSRLIVFFTRYTVCMYACHTACSFGTCNNDLICNWTAFHLASLLIELGYLSPGIDGFTLIYSTSDGLNWNIFHCYGRNHNATSHAGSIKRGMRTIKGKWRTWDTHAPGYVKWKKQK